MMHALANTNDRQSPYALMVGRSGASVLLERLINQGVDTLFGYPGGAIMPTYDALTAERGRLRHIQVRHEAAAIFGAQGYSRCTGRVGVCLVTSGPGALNITTGLADAKKDSVPLICITGQVPSSLLGTDAFQECDIISVTAPICKWSYQIRTANEVPAVIDIAFKIATSGRPGPVVIDITKDAQSGIIVDPVGSIMNELQLVTAAVDSSLLSRATLLIEAAKKPLILAGNGVIISKAESTLVAFAEKGNIPVACTLHGLTTIPTRHPLNVGMLGMHGNYAPNILTNQADLIIAVGMRFDDRVTGNLKKYAPHAKVIHIDIDAAEINKNVPAYLGITGDAKEVLDGLLSRIHHRHSAEWFELFGELRREEFEAVMRHDLAPKGGGILMSEAVRALSDLAGEDTIFTTDVGQHQMMAARYLELSKPRTLLTSGGLGSMGFGIPAAIGAAIATPGKKVIAIVGDGGFQMTSAELQTLRQLNLPVKVIVLNNEYLGMVRQWQDLFHGGNQSEVHFSGPDYMTLAKAYRIEGIQIKAREELKQELVSVLSHDQPALVEIVVERSHNVFPMIPPGAGVGEMRLR
jgi:acetolactate synthase-1/2/3 large subunit